MTDLGRTANRERVTMKLVRAFVFAVTAAGALSVSASASAQSRIAVVDVQHAVMQTEDGIRAQATLKKLFDRSQQKLDAKQVEMQRAREDIEKQSRVLSREALQKRMEDWQRKMVDLQTDFVEYNKDLQKKQSELTAPIIKKMVGLIGRLAKKSGFEIVIDKQATPYARPDLDLTDRVIQLYNSGGDAEAASDDGSGEKGDAPSKDPSKVAEEKKTDGG